ncbi:MAG: hypothetical protein K2W96_10720, partial [Gemmataceae bacterium]|nr:hypothetical protein [Gemmataceae bacterium]
MVNVCRHPLLLHKLTELRDTATDVPSFRALVRDLARLLFWEAMADAPTEAAPCRTPLAECAGHRLAWRVGLVPILRAGLGMADALLELLPSATVYHLGLFRDHETLQPVTYYDKLLLSLETDGNVAPEDALALAARNLQDQLQLYINFYEPRQ